jgi:hypothetical protein
VPTGLSDTDSESLRVHIDLLRRATPGRRLELALSLSADVVSLALAGIRRRHPGISDTAAALHFVEMHYGTDLGAAVSARVKGGPRS